MLRYAALACLVAACGGGEPAAGGGGGGGGGATAPDAGGDASADAQLGPDAARPDASPPPLPITLVDPDPAGSGATLFSAGAPDPSGLFFTVLGTNGRSCATCHDRTAGWSVTPAGLQARFAATSGTDPIFRPVDGAVSPTADVSTVAARQTAYAVLLAKGLIRVGMPLPAGAEFTLAAVDDPYGYASATELSLFRRILPATNLVFEATVMWDGREPDLTHQATDATLGHAQAGSADPTQIAAIVTFERALYTAQESDTVAGALGGSDATGGTAGLAAQPYYYGINDPFGRDPMHGNIPTNQVFTMFTAWGGLTGTDAATQRKLSIARGEALFNSRTFAITGIPGIADQGSATCSTCHDTPGTGGHSIDELMSLGMDSSDRRTADLPLYTLQRTSDGTTVQTSDPGAALVTGKWADIGKVKVPNLRGLAMRAPYFHNGFSPTLADVVQLYDDKFSINLSTQDKADLVAFLSAL